MRATRQIGRSTPGSNGLLANSAILSVTMLGVSGANYVLNVLMARILSPAEFGDANLAVNIVLVAAAIAATLQLLTVKAVAARPDSREEIRRAFSRTARYAGAFVALALALGAPALAETLRTSTPWLFVIIGLGMPIYFEQAVQRGVLQGELRFMRLAASYGCEALVRAGGALGLLALGFGVVGASVAISASFIASAAITRHGTGEWARATQPSVRHSTSRHVIVGSLVLLTGQVIINNGDVVLSKAFFAPETAGIYASAALIGRAVFFLSWSVVHALFPIAARADVSLAERRAAFRQAVLVVAGIGFAALAAVEHSGDVIADALFGGLYGSGAAILGPYVIATTLFAIANLIASADLASGRTAAAWLLLGGSLLQTSILLAVGETPPGMVRAQIVAMAATALAVSVAHVRAERIERSEDWSIRDMQSHREESHAEHEERGADMNARDGSSPALLSDRVTDLSVVIPAYNEKDRIVPTIGAFVSHLGGSGLEWELIVSDDGSTDQTGALVEMLGQNGVRLLAAPHNAGKGAAVRRGLQSASGRLVLFADADCSTPVTELDKLIGRIEEGADLAIGSRSGAGMEAANRSTTRRVLTAGLRWVVRVGLGLGVDDTQCGFKLLTAEAARRITAAQTLDGFSFDLEMLHLAERFGYLIDEVPVRWFDAPGSKVDPHKEVARFLSSIARIRLNSIRGVYQNA